MSIPHLSASAVWEGISWEEGNLVLLAVKEKPAIKGTKTQDPQSDSQSHSDSQNLFAIEFNPPKALT